MNSKTIVTIVKQLEHGKKWLNIQVHERIILILRCNSDTVLLWLCQKSLFLSFRDTYSSVYG